MDVFAGMVTEWVVFSVLVVAAVAGVWGTVRAFGITQLSEREERDFILSRELNGARARVEKVTDRMISVLHDGSLTWDDLQHMKEYYWGEDVDAVEYYPRRSKLVDNVTERHIWRVPAGTVIDDLLEDRRVVTDHDEEQQRA